MQKGHEARNEFFYSFENVGACNTAHMMGECEMDSVAAGSDRHLC